MNRHTLHFPTSALPVWEETSNYRSGHVESPSLASQPNLDQWEQRKSDSQQVPVWKRAFDIGLILIILPVILVLALLVCCWIKAVSPGPVLYRQTRIGRGGKPFTIYKFRSMKPMAETCPHEDHVEYLIKSNKPMTKLDLSGDPRVITGCRVIRMSGLDELPQLLNVLRGEMSLVGPRPCTPNEFSLYKNTQLRRFSLQPGLTGLWQVKRTQSTTFRDMVAMDELYADRLSFALDLQIVVETPGVMVRQLGAFYAMRPRDFGSSMNATQRPG